MSICQRDQHNHGALANARAVVDVMEKTCVDVDIHTLGQYLSLVVTTDDGNKIVDAINRLDPIVHNLKSRMTYGTDTYGTKQSAGGDGWRAPEAHIRDKEEIIKFFQSLIGVIDTLMHRGLVPRESFQSWHARRSQLNTFVGKAKVSVEKSRVKFGMEAQAAEAERLREEDNGAGVVRRMSKAEWAAKVFKSKGRRDRAREENRQKAVGRWWIGGKERERIQLGREEEPGGGFADSALELSAR